MKLRSFKLQFQERRARVVPLEGPGGCPFSGPGVDRLGEAFEELRALAAPLLWELEGLEPGIQVRSLSMDLERGRLLATLEAEGRPRVIRIENPYIIERLLGQSEGLLAALARGAQEALGAREAAGEGTLAGHGVPGAEADAV